MPHRQAQARCVSRHTPRLPREAFRALRRERLHREWTRTASEESQECPGSDGVGTCSESTRLPARCHPAPFVASLSDRSLLGKHQRVLFPPLARELEALEALRAVVVPLAG